jgi:hypothetical protein
MNARVPVYEGDGLLHDALVRARKPAPVKVARPAPVEVERPAAAPGPVELDLTHEDLAAIEQRARALRAEAMGAVFSGLFRAVASLFGAIERSLYRAQQRDLEHYLSQATDPADLERRLREIERSPNLDPYWPRR